MVLIYHSLSLVYQYYIMITITLENSEKLDKTHFADLDELLAYLNGRLSPKFPHENPKFMDELNRRSQEYKDNPSAAVPFKESLDRIRGRIR